MSNQPKYAQAMYTMTVEVDVLLYTSDDPDWIQTPKAAHEGLRRILERQLGDEPGTYRIIGGRTTQFEEV